MAGAGATVGGGWRSAPVGPVAPYPTPQRMNFDTGGSLPEATDFVRTLFSVTSDAPTACIRWGRDGTSFIIADVNRFGAEVLPLFGLTTKIASWTRSLVYYRVRSTC